MFDKKMLESAELYDKRYKNFATLIIFPILVLFSGIFIFALFGRKELIVTSVGEIRPVKVVAQIQSTSNNLIVQNDLSEGKLVKKNEQLIRYNSDSDTTQLETLVKQVNQFQAQKESLGLLEKSLLEDNNQFSSSDSFGYEQTYLNYQSQVQTTRTAIDKSNQVVTDQNKSIESSQSALTHQIKTIDRQIEAYKAIEKSVIDGTALDSNNEFKAQYDVYQNQIKAIPQGQGNSAQKEAVKMQFLSSLQGNVNQLKNQKDSLSAQSAGLNKSNSFDKSLDSQLAVLKSQFLQNANKEKTSLEYNILELNTKITLQKQTDKNTLILANEDGIIHLFPNVMGVKNIPTGTPIGEIYPELKGKTQIKLTSYLPSSLISGVKNGQIMRFTVQQSLPKPEILVGKITEIDNAPTSDKTQNFYKVQATVDVQESDLSRIKYGLQGKTVVVIGNKTYFDYYKDKLLGRS